MKIANKFFKRIAVVFLSVLMLVTATACAGGDNGIKITFMVEGSVYQTVTLAEDGAFTLPEDPTKTDMSFLGWYLDDGVWENKLTTETQVAENLTVYARFGNLLNLTYYVHNNLYYEGKMDGSSTVQLPAEPQIDGFRFDGWYFLSVSNGQMTNTKLTADYFVNNNTQQSKKVGAKMTQITKDNSSTGTYRISGNYLYMGVYPTAYYSGTPSLKSQTPVASGKYKGYYEGTNGKYYAKVDSAVVNAKRTPLFFQDESTVIQADKTYYFVVEEIKWRIIEKDTDTALVMPTQIMFRHKFQDATNANSNNGIDVRDYKASDIRAYMNGELINQIFTAEERAVILTSWVDNSKDQVGWKNSKLPCPWEDTYDKLFLMSQKDFNGYFGGAIDYSAFALKVSDYQRATGMRVLTTELNGGDNGYSNWWLRSRSNELDSPVALGCAAPGAGGKGHIPSAACNVYEDEYGVVPVFRVDL